MLLLTVIQEYLEGKY